MNLITRIDKFFHNSPGAERCPGTPLISGRENEKIGQERFI